MGQTFSSKVESIKSVSFDKDRNTVTLNMNDNTTKMMILPTATQGVGIRNAKTDGKGKLILTMSDYTTFTIPLPEGQRGPKGDQGLQGPAGPAGAAGGANYKSQADFQLGSDAAPERGPVGSARALVRDSNSALTVNYRGDFKGGVSLQGPNLVIGDGPHADWTGVNMKRRDGKYTHFDWKDDQRNYIRGDTVIDGNISLHDNKLYIRTLGDNNHTIQWAREVDGPKISGNLGGMLTTVTGGEKTALKWQPNGKVVIPGELCIGPDENNWCFTPNPNKKWLDIRRNGVTGDKPDTAEFHLTQDGNLFLNRSTQQGFVADNILALKAQTKAAQTQAAVGVSTQQAEGQRQAAVGEPQEIDIISTGPNSSVTLSNGAAIKCTSNDVGAGVNSAVYRYVGQKTLRHYPNPEIANTWDNNWMKYIKGDCKNYVMGPPMKKAVQFPDLAVSSADRDDLMFIWNAQLFAYDERYLLENNTLVRFTTNLNNRFTKEMMLLSNIHKEVYYKFFLDVCNKEDSIKVPTDQMQFNMLATLATLFMRTKPTFAEKLMKSISSSSNLREDPQAIQFINFKDKYYKDFIKMTEPNYK